MNLARGDRLRLNDLAASAQRRTSLLEKARQVCPAIAASAVLDDSVGSRLSPPVEPQALGATQRREREEQSHQNGGDTKRNASGPLRAATSRGKPGNGHRG